MDEQQTSEKLIIFTCNDCKYRVSLTSEELENKMFVCPSCGSMNSTDRSTQNKNSNSNKYKSFTFFKNYKILLTTLIVLVIVMLLIFLREGNNETRKTSEQYTTKSNNIVDKEEALNATLRDFNNAFRSCNPSNCASYYKEQKMRDQYSKNLSGMFDEYGCPKNSEMSDIKINFINETSAEVTFRWVWFCNFEKENRFYRGGVYAGPFTKGNRLMQATFEKGAPGWQLTKMKTLEKGKDERSWSLSEWKRM